MRLRVIDFGLVSPVRSQAVYHGIATTFTPESDPVLCLVSSKTPYVCVGVHQEVSAEVDEDYCNENDLPIYRRQVGGGAVYLDENQLFTQFVYPAQKAPEFAKNLYPLFIEPFVRTYQQLGINAQYRAINDIQVDGRKIGGTGVASIGDATVMVASFMFDFDTKTMSRCLKVPSEKFRDKLKKSLDDYMTTMAKQLDKLPSREQVIERFLVNCSEVLGVEPIKDEASKEEWEAIKKAEKTISDPKWTYKEGRKLVDEGLKISANTHLKESTHKAQGGLIRIHLLEHEGEVADLRISGDFTCLPSDGIDLLAEQLQGVTLAMETLETAILQVMKAANIEMPGIEPADIARAIMAAAQPSE